MLQSLLQSSAIDYVVCEGTVFEGTEGSVWVSPCCGFAQGPALYDGLDEPAPPWGCWCRLPDSQPCSQLVDPTG